MSPNAYARSLLAVAVMSFTTLSVLARADEGTDSTPKALSGMSVLGNSEAPKSLVIVPWKTSDIGDGISVSNMLDGRARPVDKDVFVRELDYYELTKDASPKNENGTAPLSVADSVTPQQPDA